jgi:hypothetical protein
MPGMEILTDSVICFGTSSANRAILCVLIKPANRHRNCPFLLEAWQKGGYGSNPYLAPVTIAYLISFVAYGFWPLKLIGMTEDAFTHPSSRWHPHCGCFDVVCD